jgi:hypothetical protein
MRAKANAAIFNLFESIFILLVSAISARARPGIKCQRGDSPVS